MRGAGRLGVVVAVGVLTAMSAPAPAAVAGWWETGDLATARYYHSATVLADGRVLVAGGGANDGLGALASAELFDPATGAWTATGSMAFARKVLTATRLVNAIPAVCRARPGLLSALDLPLVTGRGLRVRW